MATQALKLKLSELRDRADKAILPPALLRDKARLDYPLWTEPTKPEEPDKPNELGKKVNCFSTIPICTAIWFIF